MGGSCSRGAAAKPSPWHASKGAAAARAHLDEAAARSQAVRKSPLINLKMVKPRSGDFQAHALDTVAELLAMAIPMLGLDHRALGFLQIKGNGAVCGPSATLEDAGLVDNGCFEVLGVPELDHKLASQLDLWEACERGDVGSVQLVCSHCPDRVRQTNRLESTALHAAAAGAHVEIVKLLLRADADPSASDHYGNTPLLAAARAKHPELVRMLLAADADPNGMSLGPRRDCNDGIAPIHIAVINHDIGMLATLLRANASPEVEGYYGFTALRMAKEYEHTDIVQLLQPLVFHEPPRASLRRSFSMERRGAGAMLSAIGPVLCPVDEAAEEEEERKRAPKVALHSSNGSATSLHSNGSD
eukprot:TRINITY_DN49833_c0_g1_i1.p1 TRINITY_DN49833_c0_g1~~TRINITY_DN49833_c0_g1_i1.p1  ORF type:complete len:358 (+),score=104.04 TRINITY_DN49833_c0_g1_i1:146-1219(+)